MATDFLFSMNGGTKVIQLIMDITRVTRRTDINMRSDLVIFDVMKVISIAGAKIARNGVIIESI
jgi:hypothetical protein